MLVYSSLSSPEDVILNKLRWYRMGGERSERQWLDVQGVLMVQAGLLRAGTVWVNCCSQFDPASPFGGYWQSGYGREMGHEALDSLYKH